MGKFRRRDLSKNKLSPMQIKEILNKNGFLNVEIYSKDKSEKTCFIAKV